MFLLDGARNSRLRCLVSHPLLCLPKGRMSASWGGEIHVSDRGEMVSAAPWSVCWGVLAHVLEFPNKNKQKNLSSHWCGVLASQELDFLEPVSSCYSTRRSHDWELQVPREDVWRSLGHNFGIEGGPLVFSLSLPLQFTLHDILSCTLCSSQSELLLPSMPWWPPCLCSNNCLSLEHVPGKAELSSYLLAWSSLIFKMQLTHCLLTSCLISGSDAPISGPSEACLIIHSTNIYWVSIMC